MTDYKKKLKNGDFIGSDLHVHTPASKCYKGEKNDSEYIEIIRRYYEKNVKILAITDHNTIAGYKKMLSAKQALINKMAVLSEFLEKHEELKIEYEKIKSDVNMFESMLILPGIEFEAKPGIHMLLIFDPKSETERIEQFLIESGYSEDVQGDENPETISNLDVLDLLSKSVSLNALVIGAHIDSNKGIYNKLEGVYRSSVFRSNQLIAISYNNPVTASKIKSILQNRDYKRDKPLAYIQCSDYHGGEDNVGSCVTYLKLDKLDYESFISVFDNPNERISLTPNPETIQIIEETVKDPSTRTYESFGPTDKYEDLTKVACAILNDGYGSIVFGVSTSYGFNIVGIQKDEKSCLDIIDKIIDPLMQSNPFSVNARVMFYSFNNQRFVVIIRLSSKRKCLFSINENDAYIFEDSVPVKASSKTIEKLVEKNLLNKFDEYQKINQRNYDNIIREITLLKDDTRKFLIVNRIDKESIKLADIVNLSYCHKYLGEFNPKHINGESTGDIYFAERHESRLPYAYLRCTCPRTNEYNLSDINSSTHKGEAIIIAPGGGCFIINSEEWKLVAQNNEPLIVLQIRELYKDIISLSSLVGWLKSSLLLWYNGLTAGDINIHNINILKNTPVPMAGILDQKCTVEDLVIEMSKIEYKFLEELNTQHPVIDMDNEASTDAFSALINNHNKEVSEIAKKIDKEIFAKFKITDSEEEILKGFFDIKNIFSVI